MDTLETLIAARAEIAKGWCQNALYDAAGNCCAVGALARVGDIGAGESKGYHTLVAALPDGFVNVPQFNNHPDTTQADVIALFDRAANAEAAKAAVPVDPSHTYQQAA